MFLKGVDYYKDKFNILMSRKGYIDPWLLPDEELLGFVLQANNEIAKGIIEQTLSRRMQDNFGHRLEFIYQQIPKVMEIELLRRKVYDSIYWEEYNAILEEQWIEDGVTNNSASLLYTNYPNFSAQYKEGYAAYMADTFAKNAINSSKKDFFNCVGEKENHLITHLIEDSDKYE